jgi:division protein CdvB (Snf7/Vps24/ESCRT-III family)
VNAQKSNNSAYAKAYALELCEIRKMNNMVGGAKLAMEQIQIRLNTVSELGDVVVTLSPCMSVIKGLSSSLSGIMPEANSSMQDLSKILGDVMGGSTVGHHDLMAADNSSADTIAILEEAHAVIEGQTKTSIPEIPLELKEEIAARKEALI